MAGIQPQNGFVVNPYTVRYTDAAPATYGQGGEQLISLRGGKYAAAALRGQVFCSTLIATLIRLFTIATPTFALLNPVGSGVNVELIRSDFCDIQAACVVNGLGIYFHTAVQAAAWSSLTVSTPAPQNAFLGAASGKAIVYSSITQASNPKLQTLTGGWGATTNTGLGVNRYDFDGHVIIPPGVGITICTTTAGSTNTGVLTWMEYAA
jgi:hypothetical protein